MKATQLPWIFGLLLSVMIAASSSISAGTQDLEKAVKKKSKRLTSRNVLKRAEAAYWLGEAGASALDAVPKLLPLLADESNIIICQDSEGAKPQRFVDASGGLPPGAKAECRFSS